MRTGGEAVDNVVRAAHRMRVNRCRRRNAMRVTLRRRLTPDLMADLLLKGHKAVLTRSPGPACLSDRLYLMMMHAKVGRLGGITLRLLALAIVLAVEQIVRADRHLLVVFLLGLAGGLTTLIISLISAACAAAVGVAAHFAADDLIVDAIRGCRFFVRSDFINVLILANHDFARVRVLPRRRAILRPSIVRHNVLARVNWYVGFPLMGGWVRPRQYRIALN